LMGCYIWYSEEGPGWAAASVSITMLLSNGPLFCSFDVRIEG